MEATINKWGNSLGIRLPKDIVRESRLNAGSEVEIETANGVITIRAKQRLEYKLEDLLKGITKENLHGETPTGRPVGKEII